MYKDYFPYFKNSNITYLDNAATTQKPQVVIDEIVDYYSSYCSNTHRSNHGNANKATQKFEHTREVLKEFINANDSSEIIFTKGVTESINFIVNSYVKNRFKKVIISSLEHHSNIVPWQILGVEIEVVNHTENLDFDFDSFENILKDNPNSFVSITHISNAFGKIHDIKRIISLAHKYKAKVLIDAAQSLTHKKVNVQDLDVDFMAISSHKTFGPTGVGAIYIKKTLLNDLLPYQTGGATINDVTYEKSILLDSPYKFEAGTQNIAGVIGFGKALEFIKELGYENIGKKEQELYTYLYEELAKIEDIIFYSDIKNSIGSFSFNIKNIMAEDVGILVDKMSIALRCGHHCAQPIMKSLGIEGTIRVSVALYNEKEDIDKLIIALKKAIKMLKD
jgi:cysteine desulfurase/selenocysteine lyase